MSKLLYKGTNENSASGYFRRYFSEFSDARGTLYRVEILDSVTSSTGFNFSNGSPQSFDLGRDGVTISWDGSADELHDPIVSSTLTMDFLLAGTRHWIFSEVLAGSVEDRFLVALFRFAPTQNSVTNNLDGKFVPEWFGTLSPEGIEYVSNESNEFLRLTASDGLAALNDVPYQQADGTIYSTDVTLAEHLGRVLEKLPTSSLWSFASGTGTTANASGVGDVYLLREVSYITTETAAAVITNVPDAYSVLTAVQAKAVAFYEIDTSTDQFGGTFATKTTSTCGQVLDSILQVLGLRIFQAEGSFWAMNWAALDDRDAYVHSFTDVNHLATRSVTQLGTQITQADAAIDLDAMDLEPVRGLSTRYLFPVHRAVSVHVKGGSTTLVSGSGTHTPLGGSSPESGVYHLNHIDEGPFATLTSPTGSVLGGDAPVLRGHMKGIPTGQGTGAFDLDVVGMKTLIQFTIKIGNYYLKRDVTAFSASSSDFVNINRVAATDFDYMDLIQDGDVEWTTTPSTYTIVTPFIGQVTPEPPVVLQGSDDTTQRVGGYHLDLRNSGDEFKFSTGFTTASDGTTDGRFADFEMAWTLPPMADDVSEHTGVEFSAVVHYKSRENGTIDPADVTALNLLNGVGGRISSFALYSSDTGSGDDVIHVADTNANRAIVKAAESILGDRYTPADSVGAMKRWNFTSNTWAPTGSGTWVTMDSQSSPTFVHELLARLTIQERKVVLRKIAGTFVFDPSQRSGPVGTLTATNRKIPTFRHLWTYTIGASAKKYAAQTMTWSVRPTTFDFEGFFVDADRTSLPDQEANDRDRKDTGQGGQGGGPTTTPGGVDGTTQAILAVKAIAQTSSGSGNLTAEQTNKLAAITIDGSNKISSLSVSAGVYPLDTDNIHPAFTFDGSDKITALDTATGSLILTADQVNDANTSHKFATAAQLTKIGTNETSIATNATNIQSNVNAIGTTSSNLTSLTSSVGTNTTNISSIQSSVNTNSSNISSLTSSVGTNTSAISTLDGEVDQIQDVIQAVTGGGGKGVYFATTKTTTNAHVSVADKLANLFAGSNTGVAVSESSPGLITLSVQAGSTGSEGQVDVIEIQGSASFQNAVVTISQPVTFQSSTSGISSSNITEGSKLFHTNARVDARIAAANVADLSDVTAAGSGQIITTAERQKLQGIATGAQVNPADTDAVTEGSSNLYHTDARVDARISAANLPANNLSSADQTITGTRNLNLGASGIFKVKANSGNSLTPLSIEANGFSPATIRVNGDLRMDSGALSGGILKLEESPTAGTNFVALQAPTSLSADLTLKLPATDGTNGQALTTDGSGNLSFSTISGGGGGSSSYVLASSSTRVPMYYANRYYFGSSSYGWDTDTGYSTSSAIDSSLSDDYAHMGIVAPTAISTLKIIGTLRNDSSADDVDVYVYRGSRPNGSSSNITLTELIDVDISVTQDRHQNVDATATSAGISAGDLIFVAFKRAGSNGTKYVNTSYTLHATE
ncbi:MAG: hypothetical protein ACR2MR_06370 [Dietzia maris]